MSGIKRKLAVYQGDGVLGGVAENLELIRESVSEAKSAGADLVIFPELMTSGYNLGPAISELAEAANGPAAKRIADMARSYGIAIVYGYPERDGETVYNSSQLIARNGECLLNYRKCQLYGPTEAASFQPGDSLPVVEWDGLTVGLLICYDIEFPEPSRLLAHSGAKLILVSSATSEPHREISEVLVPARACENQVFVAFCNRCGEEGDLAYTGGSCVIGPDGRALARLEKQEGLVFAEIDTAKVDQCRGIFDYFADRREDIFGAVGGA